ncbi:MAG: MlaE family lipid transporter permease subunit [Caulobacteraceae bacterium]|nr:MlaE family lipid transporter permease subunit [Caulobacteraceae bacterium]
MDTPADFTIATPEGDDSDNDKRVVRLTGDWTAINIGDAAHRLRMALKDDPATRVDVKGAGRVDTAGVLGLIDAVGDDDKVIVARPETERLLKRVRAAMAVEPPVIVKRLSLNLMMERLGRGLVGVISEFVGTMAFTGHLIATVGRAILHPGKVRWPAVINLTERAGLDAIPIVVITNFFIGAVVAFLGATMLADFGAQVFAVETVGFGVLREFAVVITAILLAGRSASAFAAEIGSMKMQQEIDAMQVMGVDPFQALVLPRFLALLSIIPLTFIAAVAGLVGGCLVLWLTVDLSPTFFMQRIQDQVGLRHFWVGLSKAPIMAIVIAGIGCRQGMLVGGDVESLGQRVTTAVVHSIFSIIMIDAIFAVVFMEMNV